MRVCVGYGISKAKLFVVNPEEAAFGASFGLLPQNPPQAANLRARAVFIVSSQYD